MSKNKKSLDSFIEYCQANPEQRFWQALRNWSGWPFIYASKTWPGDIERTDIFDTYYWEDDTPTKFI